MNQVQQIIKRFRNGSIPACDPVNPKRHGWKIKCSCGHKQKKGGVRNGPEYYAALKDLRNLQVKHQEHDLKIEHSYHAAELAHTFVEQTTPQTTNTNGFTTPSGATITSGNFTAGNKYLILAMVHIKGSNISTVFGSRMVHQSTAFATSEISIEPMGSTSRYLYAYFTVWTAVASEDIHYEHQPGSGDVTSDQISLVAIEISEDLTEGDDWDYNENTTGNTGLTSTFTTTNNASLTKTFNGTDTVLFLAGDRIDPATTNKEARSSVFKAGSAINGEWNQEGEDVTDEIQLHFHAYTEIPASSSITWTSRSAYESGGGGTGDRVDSRLFWLRLNSFRNFIALYDPTENALNSGDYGTVETATIDPDVTGDVLSMCYCKFEATSISQAAKFRQRISSVDQPATQTSDEYDFGSGRWDQQDLLAWAIFSVDNFGASSDIDLDKKGSNTLTMNDLQIAAFTMELPAAGGFPYSQGCIAG